MGQRPRRSVDSDLADTIRSHAGPSDATINEVLETKPVRRYSIRGSVARGFTPEVPQQGILADMKEDFMSLFGLGQDVLVSPYQVTRHVIRFYYRNGVLWSTLKIGIPAVFAVAMVSAYAHEKRLHGLSIFCGASMRDYAMTSTVETLVTIFFVVLILGPLLK